MSWYQEPPPFMIHHLYIEEAISGRDIPNRHRTYALSSSDISYTEERLTTRFSEQTVISPFTGRTLNKIAIPGPVVRVGANEPIHEYLLVYVDLARDEFRFGVDRVPETSNMLQFLIPGLRDSPGAFMNLNHWFFQIKNLHLVAEGNNAYLGDFDCRTLLVHTGLVEIRVSGSHAQDLIRQLEALYANRSKRPYIYPWAGI